MIINSPKDPIAMKVMDMSAKSAEKAYVFSDPSETHTREELDAVVRAIRYTQMFHQQESLAKMDEEFPIELPLNIPK
jgi:hypothetical protein